MSDINSMTSDDNMEIIPAINNFNFLQDDSPVISDKDCQINKPAQPESQIKQESQQNKQQGQCQPNKPNQPSQNLQSQPNKSLQSQPSQIKQPSQPSQSKDAKEIKSILKQENNVRFNENIEKINSKEQIPVVTNNEEIKMIRVGKVDIPNITVYFTAGVILMAIAIFFMTKPRKDKKNKDIN